jgi:hypothetical protein
MTKWTMTEQQFVEIMQANYYSEAGLKAIFAYLDELHKKGTLIPFDVSYICKEFKEYPNLNSACVDKMEKTKYHTLQECTTVLTTDIGSVVLLRF